MDQPDPLGAQVRAQYENDCATFKERTQSLGIHDLDFYHWYHTVDLGDGIITPGIYDYRSAIHQFPFPQDMSGLSLLEVGSATGFFAFEAERRGAQVTSVELPSLHSLDRFPGQTQALTLRKLVHMRSGGADAPTDPLIALGSAQTYFYHLDGPFQFCYRRLNSKLSRVYSSIYDLDKTDIAASSFDYVLLGDVLLHLINPMQALAVAAKYARKYLIISQQLSTIPSDKPLIEYVGGSDPEKDDISWLHPNFHFFDQFCRKLGFAHVEEVGRNQGYLRPTGSPYDRPILLASRA